ncbi:thiol-disulfide isomerase [Pseudoalteromonas rubra]|uniref:Thiol-disulfide isomerase n=1 Tax=Pseudoalteromonas rubra TaxID=43658 RepID=A0A5S3WKV5_9GAMM|nr:glutaredoxin family protein [Pseudoalteromonas rubra]TMP28251.1 thiol-disulfide isomerase [Pseudoalteromonas rubra]TMP34953.1 thiol-disulfide isomerase [Pseudoalteromonas rubra]
MAKLTLFYTDGCHLCEQAYELVLRCVTSDAVIHKDIVDDPQLMAEYQTSIPVLKSTESARTLFWPFTEQDIKELLK